MSQPSMFPDAIEIRHNCPIPQRRETKFRNKVIPPYVTFTNVRVKGHQKVSSSDPHPPSEAIYTDGSHLEGETGCAFCVIQNNVQIHQWTAKLSPHNSVFQVEILAIKEAINWASSKGISVSIWSDSESALRAISSFKSSNPLIEGTQQDLLQNPSMQLNWIKAHVGFLGNEAADNLAKQATKEGTHLHFQAPKYHLKKCLGTSLSINDKSRIQATLREQF
ncbi:hypothetical protein AVEN_127869-1 [Araneus ventricosus]|uniref:RNase H type-1 domain-containing protein n=1 Tax=Araneus ventricosus TaxID=182803 RepID=A0A4Y1ZZ83_ARAVE|nr:hypothetical protein AVEN_127869-1 [Araneus ventricosus]